MSTRTALVTGAAGFLGRHLVRALSDAGWQVRAGIHHERDRSLFSRSSNVEPLVLDLADQSTLTPALRGVEHLYHCAALVDSHASRARLLDINAAGTRTVWEAASAAGVGKALYVSTAAVYGLLGSNGASITERFTPRAIEPYGYSKLAGEYAALEIAAQRGLHTTIIRPVAIFGPGEHTPFGRDLRHAAYSKVLVAGGFQGKRFSFVHVEDVAAAARHVLGQEFPSGEIFNVAVDEPIPFEQAFREYAGVLKRAGREYTRVRILAAISTLLHKSPSALRWMSMFLGGRHVFGIWHPGFDRTYSSGKLLSTGFTFRWREFGGIFASCMEERGGASA